MHEMKVGLVCHWRGPTYLSRCVCGWVGWEQPTLTLAVDEHAGHVAACCDVVAEAERIAREAVS